MYTREQIHAFIHSKGLLPVRALFQDYEIAERQAHASPYLIEDPYKNWSWWAMTIPHILVPSLNRPSEILNILDTINNVDDSYEYYEALISEGYHINLSTYIHTKVLKCSHTHNSIRFYLP